MVGIDSFFVWHNGYRYSFYRFVSGIGSLSGTQIALTLPHSHITLKNDSLLISSNGDSYGINGFSIISRNSHQLLTSTPINLTAFGPSFGGAGEIVSGWGNLIYVAFRFNGFQIYDISNPSSPVRLGNGINFGDFIFDLTADDKYAYIANGYEGVRIVNLQTHSEIAGSPFKWQTNVRYVQILLSDKKLYGIWKKVNEGGFTIVNINIPVNPLVMGEYGYSDNSGNPFPRFAVQIGDSLLFLGLYNHTYIHNIKNPTSITEIGYFSQSDAFDHLQILYPYIYLCSGFNYSTYSGYFSIYNISNPASPVFQDSIRAPFEGPFAMNGKYAFCLFKNSIKRYNVSNPSDIRDAGTVMSSLTMNAKSIELAGNYLHVGYKDNTIRIIDISDSTQYVVKDSLILSNGSYINRLKISGSNLFAACLTDGWYHISDGYGGARVFLSQVTGVPRDTVTMPVRVIDQISQLGAISFEMFFPFDTNYVQFVNLQRGPGLPVGDSLLSTVSHSSLALHTDTLKVTHADTGSIAGADTLLKLKFRIKDTAPISPLIQSTPVSLSHIQFNEGSPAVSARDGYIQVIPRFGDANQNGSVTAVDASYILQSVLGLVAQPPLVVSDVSNNGEVRAYDASLILKRLVYPAFKYPVETYYGLKQATAPVNKDVQVMITAEHSNSESDKIAEIANSIVYGISMKNVKEILSAEMVIDLGESQKYVGHKLSALSEGMTIQSKQEGNLLYLSMAGSEAITKDGMLLELICQITDPEKIKPIDIQQFILNETVIETIEGALSGTPKTYALSQNYPNPFNPVTEIKYQLPNAGKVTLTIYNILVLGQQIKNLVNANRTAGYYSVIWNGKDELGINVASGVYFYRIQSGSFVKTRKMILIK